MSNVTAITVPLSITSTNPTSISNNGGISLSIQASGSPT